MASRPPRTFLRSILWRPEEMAGALDPYKSIPGLQNWTRPRSSRLWRTLETRDPYSDAEDTTKVVVLNNLTVIMRLWLWYRNIRGDDDKFPKAVFNSLGIFAVEDRRQLYYHLNGLLDVLVCARRLYLRAFPYFRIPQNTTPRVTRFLNLLDQLLDDIDRRGRRPEVSPSDLLQLHGLQRDWNRARQADPKSLITSDPPAAAPEGLSPRNLAATLPAQHAGQSGVGQVSTVLEDDSDNQTLVGDTPRHVSERDASESESESDWDHSIFGSSPPEGQTLDETFDSDDDEGNNSSNHESDDDSLFVPRTRRGDSSSSPAAVSPSTGISGRDSLQHEADMEAAPGAVLGTVRDTFGFSRGLVDQLEADMVEHPRRELSLERRLQVEECKRWLDRVVREWQEL
ncbi:hypothetical protein B0T22DRAFT_506009 [Podospora appendiculata]|uniref:Uncharacterized protein n=1 Tax=Podospora appendiculata TaxID=314037 RepID=A0AAE0XI82_9PEZI|nr:hypothetical protein B0T22DRAFT_506009 [Podospora appendiculata]